MKKLAGAEPSKTWFRKLWGSIWLFPVILTVLLLLLTALKVNGSSLGVYHGIFYGTSSTDSDLLLNEPRPIRSDEWVVNTQMTIAQKNDSFHQINQNIGNGQDMSVLLDVPYAEWSQVFKPQNWSFFAMAFDYAFALKWWLLAYFLVLSCYFFVLALLPGRRLLAACLGVALLFAAMIQWWYQFATLAPVYYSLFMATAVIYLVRAKQRLHTILWGALLAYLLVAFVLVLYPPFQIACALALAAFVIGYLLQALRGVPRKTVWRKLGVLAGAALVAGAFTLLFLQTRSDVIHTIENTAYPGKRVVASGGFDAAHLFSGHLGFQFQFTSKADHYHVINPGYWNQSESSNFILLLPFLFLPCLYIIFQDFLHRKKPDWPLIAVNAAFVLFLLWMFVPNLDFIGKLFLLDKVPLARLLLGLGLLNLFQIVLLIRRLQDFKDKLLAKKIILIYSALILIVEFLLGWYAMDRFPGFIGMYRVIAFSLPVPVIVYLLLSKRFTLAAVGFLAFSVFTTVGVNPLYRGTSIITQTPLSRTIQDVAARDNGVWATEISYLENFAIFNGARSIAGVYAYPQLDLWRSADDGTQEDIYNRYAHTNFVFDRELNTEVKTKLELVGGDHFGITTEPCGPYVRERKIRFILTTSPLYDSCLQLERTVMYPAQTFLIYKVNQ